MIGPDTTLKDCEVGGARRSRDPGELAVIGQGPNVGPFAYLRPGHHARRGRQDRRLRRDQERRDRSGAKVPHLSYVGDAEIGEGANIGAGTIFANYDGVRKHRTTVGDRP